MILNILLQSYALTQSSRTLFCLVHIICLCSIFKVSISQKQLYRLTLPSMTPWCQSARCERSARNHQIPDADNEWDIQLCTMYGKDLILRRQSSLYIIPLKKTSNNYIFGLFINNYKLIWRCLYTPLSPLKKIKICFPSSTVALQLLLYNYNI